ncbi:MAG TPA: hypothetical protein PKY31_09240 [Spirochaetota bacterium]|nr:hypothetical protein [Spirochaetota bacterium]
MAQEFEILENPTSSPEAVSTGYQRQNTNMLAGRVGVDLSYVEADGADAVVKIAGPVDVNGILYQCKQEVTLTPASEGAWFIRLKDAGGDFLEPELTQDAITWDPSKMGFYDISGRRVLNWVVRFDGVATSEVRKIYPPSLQPDIPPKTWITGDGSWVAPESKFYDIWVTGSGEAGGAGGDGGRWADPIYNLPTAGTLGGRAGSSGFKRIFIEAGTEWTAAYGGAGAAVVFSDGVTTLSAGGSGGAATGFDKTFIGGGGGYGGSGAFTPTGTTAREIVGHPGAAGGASIWGPGGNGGAPGAVYANGGAGGAASSYGSGGGSGGGASSCVTDGFNQPPIKTGGAGGAGALGVILVIG